MGMGENAGALGSSSLAAPYVVVVELEGLLQLRTLYLHRCRKTEYGYQDINSGRYIPPRFISSIYYITSIGHTFDVALISGSDICPRDVLRGYFIPRNAAQVEQLTTNIEVSPNVVA